MRIAFVASLALLASCGRYVDFSLPKLSPQPGAVRWEWQMNPDPVIFRGGPGNWDSVDVLNPSVVKQPSGVLTNLYSGYDGKAWHTGLAHSTDGVHWTERRKLLSPDPATWEGGYIASNGSTLLVNGKYLYWYQGGRVPRIGLASSDDSFDWTKHGTPVLETGPRGSWDERGVADPYVIRIGTTFYMYYLGQDRARRQRLGVARSEDGVHWQKHLRNPILELGEPGAFDETGLGEPAVWQQHGSYWMLYTARDRREYRRLGFARSQDGVSWARVTEQPVLSGTAPWNNKVVCDPTVILDGDRVRVWFGGGNRAEPAENLDGQIGYGVLRLKVGD